MNRLVPTSLDSLISSETDKKFSEKVQGPYLSSLSLLLNDKGGIIDDLIVTRQGEET